MSKTRTIIEFDPQDFTSTATTLNMVEAAMKMHMDPSASIDKPTPDPLAAAPKADPAPDPVAQVPPSVEPGSPADLAAKAAAIPAADVPVAAAANPSNLTYDGKNIDSAGVPWCQDIHQKSRGKMANGTFKKKKGLDKAFYDASIIELKRAIGGDVETAASVETVAPDPATTAAPDPVTNPAAAAGAPVHTYEQLFARFQKAVTEQRTVPTKLNEICVSLGLANATLITTQPEMVDEIWTILDTELGVDL